MFKKEYASSYGLKLLQDLSEKISAYNEKNNECRAKMEMVDDSDNFVVAIVTPLMLRIHEHVMQSGEMVFIGMLF